MEKMGLAFRTATGITTATQKGSRLNETTAPADLNGEASSSKR